MDDRPPCDGVQMTLLLAPQALAARREVAAGSLRPLAESLRADLAPVIAAGGPWIPAEKARLTRLGGRCPTDGVLLEFEPTSPHAHRCPHCGAIYRDEAHHRWWIMNYQLWLAERAVHGATLYALCDDHDAGDLSRRILEGYCARYLDYPNADNVLGPTRPFFSTYLESIWLVQLAVALDLLEQRDGVSALGGRVRERIMAPSAELIAAYDEGLSNRQVWNNAALAAAGALLGVESMVDRAISSPSGLLAHTSRALLADGTWYEGENYHLFAHRGLWCVTAIAEAQGWVPEGETARRLAEGFATPFATALPDLTFPSRRDSQYRVSLRQWRIAESCELGLSRADDPRLRSALAELYRDDVPSGDTGRARSTAEAECNVPAARLSRAALGWKSLLFARGVLPPLAGHIPSSSHLDGQGFAVLRREAGRTYVALDYGESGGGHGHPDRLNLWLVVGESRILEDVGTGSYVDPSLHWYRSTLAHNAPLIDGRSQWQVDGQLLAWDERGGAGWVSASALVAPDVRVQRTVVAMPGYLVDEVRWEAPRVVTFDLPWHVDAKLDAHGEWRSATLAGGRGVEDGFQFLDSADNLPGVAPALLSATVGDVDVRSWVTIDTPHEWWRCLAPGPPGEARRPFLLLRGRERSGCVRSVWAWSTEVHEAAFDAARTIVRVGALERHAHERIDGRWHIALSAGRAQSSIDLDPLPTHGVDADGADDVPAAAPGDRTLRLPVLEGLPPELGELLRTATEGPARNGARTALRFRLGPTHYRRSEEPWSRAGTPEALVALGATAEAIVVEVAVRKEHPYFAPARVVNELDNEHPDINSDGVQLYLGALHGGGAGGARYYSWILVPERDDGAVRITARTAFGQSIALRARWRPTPNGYLVRCVVPRAALGEQKPADFTLDLIVNESAESRERRRGQLVLSGGHDEWIYLRGDRQDPARAIAFHIDES